MARINIRSPYHVNVTAVNLTSAVLELYIYTGTQTTDRGTVKYTLNSTAYDEEVTFEISELVRDYLDVTFDGTYTSQMVWVDYQITQSISGSPIAPSSFVALLGFDGYGYFTDGANPQNNNNDICFSNTIIHSLYGQVTVAVYQEAVSQVIFKNGVSTVETNVITPTDDSDDSIRYFTYNFTDPEDYIDNVDFITQGGDVNVPIKWTTECKHTPYKLTFVNKFGALQDLYFFKRTNLSLETSKNDYKGNILSSGTYSINEHQNKILNKQGQEKLVLNSGFVDEQYNEVFRQLMLSEKVWIEYDSQTLPINVSSAGLPFKDSLNDRLINYTINVDFAFDKINSVR